MKENKSEKLYKIVKKIRFDKSELKRDAIDLFETLGYVSPNKMDLIDSPKEFYDNFKSRGFNPEKAFYEDWVKFH